MKLEGIKDPSFLKDASISELNELSSDIRHFLVDSLSKTGGHLASNLGVVELSVALHKVFDSPKDKIIFDVGHQSYVHKILTGRGKDFSSLRKHKGLSGFPKRKESIHDVWESGHSSTSLSAALGMAIARDMNHDDYQVIAVIGDGAISSGMALEALNEIGEEKRKMIVILNDNEMSISKNVGAVNSSLAKMRTSKAYGVLKSSIKNSIPKNKIGKSLYHSLAEIKNKVRTGLTDGGIFEEFGIDYLGPVNGHRYRDLLPALEMAKNHHGPIVIHVLTKKGKGYEPCENDESGAWHGVGPFNAQTGDFLNKTTKGTISNANVVTNALIELAERDKDIVCISPAMVHGSSLGSFYAKYPKRSFDTGIAEEHAATFAAGLALSGKKPFLCIYSSFLQRAYDQVHHDIARQDARVVIGVDHAGLVGGDGETHQGIYDVAFLRTIPNIMITHGKDAIETRNLLYTAFHQNHPFVIRYPKSLQSDEVEDMKAIEIGSWEVIYEPKKVIGTIITYGDDVYRFKETIIANLLPYRLINARFLNPIDIKKMDQLIQEQLPIYSYESDVKEGGLSSAILSYLNEKNSKQILRRFGLPSEYIEQGDPQQIKRELGLDIPSVIETILKGNR
ncbi:1-deoxy-D-xylulose-5-phosphate synthase [Bulleidia sp. zg-1006]|uniref:1-deoxy-D-xylulose-5-phosphate synthase n=1 Tax=Bulleidia sp. zg-1006 TaxID=2806552 RepID=UPI00193A5763|nr:1-deoxy-D-xylulose-5-phosphate synthase [Bulleidia sp. zg-1006]QRG87389.1 1-deoxy-D-xylulose-5-phosphate synthase [Bulleidia sp. zg-1006]